MVRVLRSPACLSCTSLAVFRQNFVKMHIFLPNVSILTNWHFPTTTIPPPQPKHGAGKIPTSSSPE